MPSKIFIVNVLQMRGESSSEVTLFATFDREIAERYVRRYKLLDLLHERRVGALRHFNTKYLTEHQPPHHEAIFVSSSGLGVLTIIIVILFRK